MTNTSEKYERTQQGNLLVQMQLSHGNGGGKALVEEDGAVPESRNLFSRNTANCQCVEMRLIQNILLQVFVKHHIGVKIN